MGCRQASATVMHLQESSTADADLIVWICRPAFFGFSDSHAPAWTSGCALNERSPLGEGADLRHRPTGDESLPDH